MTPSRPRRRSRRHDTLRVAYHRHGAADPERTGNPFLYQWRLR